MEGRKDGRTEGSTDGKIVGGKGREGTQSDEPNSGSTGLRQPENGPYDAEGQKRPSGRLPPGRSILPSFHPSVLPSFRPSIYLIAYFSGNCFAMAPASGSAIIRMWAAASRSLV